MRHQLKGKKTAECEGLILSSDLALARQSTPLWPRSRKNSIGHGAGVFGVGLFRMRAAAILTCDTASYSDSEPEQQSKDRTGGTSTNLVSNVGHKARRNRALANSPRGAHNGEKIFLPACDQCRRGRRDARDGPDSHR